MKILTVSDLGNVATGFCRVMSSIIKHFPKDWELHSIGINYYGDPHDIPSKIYPASLSGDMYGIRRLGNLIDEIKPDAIFILQDSWVIKEYLKVIPEDYLSKTVLYVPVDAGPYNSEWLELFPKVKQVCSYTEFGKSVLLDANPEIENIKVIPHGIDTEAFFPIDQDEAREQLGKMNKDWKIFLSTNRNQPRKRYDILAKAFGIFSQDKDDVKYYHHSGVEDAGWNIVTMAQRCGFSKKLILTNKEISPQKYVTDKVLNLIYNSADFGVNFGMGEGWGLCFAKGTQVLTTTGYRKIEDILIGDEVFDKDGRPTKVTNLLVRGFSGKLNAIKVAGNHREMLATAEHPFYTDQGFVEAKDLTVNHRLLRPDIQARELFSSIDIANYSNLKGFDDWVLIKRKNVGVAVRKGELRKVQHVVNSNVTLKTYRKIKRDIKLDINLTYLLAPYLLNKRYGDKLKVLDDNQLRAAKKLFNFKYSAFSKNILLGKELVSMLNTIAYIPEIYLSLPIQCVRYVFSELLSRQSYQHPTNQRVLLSSKSLEKQDIIRIILLRLGIGFSEFVIADGTVYFTLDKKYVDYADSHRARRNRVESIDGYYYKMVSNTEVDYTGTVYNLETESHTYNAYGYTVHNCNMEHSITGKPQILGNHSALSEIYAEDRGVLIPVDHYDTMPKILTEGAVISVQHAVQALQYAYDNPEIMKQVGQNARKYFLQDKFQWKNISNQFKEIIES